MFWKIAAIVTAVKVLLIPSYFSTDFEVHRNWLAVTYSLPFSDWYFEKTSEWTLDYPPLFAWFEKGLAQIAQYVDPDMLVISNLKYTSPATILFQRLSVIVTDIVFLLAAKQCCSTFVFRDKVRKDALVAPSLGLGILLVTNAGLLIVDHIHFQYNGFMYGILLLSVNQMAKGSCVWTSLLFATLLNLKHIYVYMAPAFFVYMLRTYCFDSNKDGSIRWLSFSMVRMLILGMVVGDIFLVSFGPFLVTGQLPQVISRLFPFKRGLCHAYWAPNFWSLYNVADKTASIVGQKLDLLPANITRHASMTGGLVQEFEHTALPSISPAVTLVCTLIVLVPALVHTFRYPHGMRGFLRCLVLCAWGAYMFGWHVHEKAILMVIIPLTLLAFNSRDEARIFLFLSTVGHCSLFPLIFTQPEMPLKYSIVLCYTAMSFIILGGLFESGRKWYRLPLMSSLETVYLFGLVLLELYSNLIHHYLGLGTRYPFLPLLLTSVYCSLGVCYSWLSFYRLTLGDRAVDTNLKTD